MRVRSLVIAVAVMFGVLIVARFAGWIGKSPTEISGQAPAAATPTDPAEAHGQPQPPVQVIDPAPTPVAPPRPPAPPNPVATTTATPTPAAGLIADWEQRIDDVLTGKEDENSKVKKLLDIFPNLPEEGQIEAAQHLSNLLPDEQYPALANTLTNAHAPEAVLDVLMTDVLNRPNPIKLSTLLDVARTPEHPKAEEARDVLEVFVDEDYGNNWAAWHEAIQKWLKENPDE